MSEKYSAYMMPGPAMTISYPRPAGHPPGTDDASLKRLYLKSPEQQGGDAELRELVDMFRLTLDSYMSNFQVTSTHMPDYMYDQYMAEMQDFADSFTQDVARTYNDALNSGVIMPEAISIAYERVGEGVRRLEGILREYDRQFAAWEAMDHFHRKGYSRCLFISEHGENVCEHCLGLHGQVFSFDEAPIPPLHPNCRCNLVIMDVLAEQRYNMSHENFIENFDQMTEGRDSGGMYVLDHDFVTRGITRETLAHISLPSGQVILDLSRPAGREVEYYDLMGDFKSHVADFGNYISGLTHEAAMMMEFYLRRYGELSQNCLDSVPAFLNWLTFGIGGDLMDGFNYRLNEMLESPGLYNIANFFTMGIADMAKGVFKPDEPWSLQHWLDILGTALILRSLFRKTRKAIDDYKKEPELWLSELDDGTYPPTAGLTPEQRNAILAIEKGNRPEPRTYLSPEYIEYHLSEYQNGVTKFMAGLSEYDPYGRPSGTFVMPTSVADNLIRICNGDIRLLEQLLGFDPYYLGDNPIRVDIAYPSGLRLPSGNEDSAYEGLWAPGGFTNHNVTEAVIDQFYKEEYVWSYILNQGGN